MAETRHFICTACPQGCMLEVTMEGDEVVKILGNTCNKGKDYGKAEATDPRRMVASTVRVSGGLHPLLPVYSSAPVPQNKITDLLSVLREVTLTAPLTGGAVVLQDPLGIGVDVIASRDMPAK